MKTKICFKCNTEKPLDEFYKHRQMADGHLNKCKECAKFDVRVHKNLDIEESRARGRLHYYKNRDRYIAISSARNIEHPERRYVYTKNWRAANHNKMKAHGAVAKKLASDKPSVCQKCGSSGRIHGHHPDYSKPLEVMWLCPKCHGLEHRKSRVVQHETGE